MSLCLNIQILGNYLFKLILKFSHFGFLADYSPETEDLLFYYYLRREK